MPNASLERRSEVSVPAVHSALSKSEGSGTRTLLRAKAAETVRKTSKLSFL